MTPKWWQRLATVIAKALADRWIEQNQKDSPNKPNAEGFSSDIACKIRTNRPANIESDDSKKN